MSLKVRKLTIDLSKDTFQVWFEGVPGSFTNQDYNQASFEKQRGQDWAFTGIAVKVVTDNIENLAWNAPSNGKEARPNSETDDDLIGLPSEASISKFFRELRKP